jgi:hypothetical protein
MRVRLQGPIYLQGAGFGLVLLGFVNYFALKNANGLSSTMWTTSIFVVFLQPSSHVNHFQTLFHPNSRR